MRFFDKLKDYGSKIVSRISRRGPAFILTEDMRKKWEQESQARKKEIMNGNIQSSVQQQQQAKQ